ncbi:MAG: HNH endonuclease [Planctomycetes bacterium]|nr:HNH endonuclease [Planctomycetota bacterium]
MNAHRRRQVWSRANYRCEYCQLHQDDEPYYRFHVEHITSKQHGGGDGLANLALACHHCNRHKGTNLSSIDPRTGNVVTLFHPRRQRWDRHFRRLGGRVVGRTQCGRATVALLCMNMRDRVEIRNVVG